MMVDRRLAMASVLLGAGWGAAMAYGQWMRPWVLQWGATAEEARQPLSGDEVVSEPAGMTTRAITIDAPPAAVWPWLVQMGQGRGGAYTYDWIENLLGLGMHSANRILPEFQHLAVDDVMLRTPDTEMRIRAFEPERYLVAASPDGTWSWAFVLAPLGDGRSRSGRGSSCSSWSPPRSSWSARCCGASSSAPSRCTQRLPQRKAATRAECTSLQASGYRRDMGSADETE